MRVVLSLFLCFSLVWGHGITAAAKAASECRSCCSTPTSTAPEQASCCCPEEAADTVPQQAPQSCNCSGCLSQPPATLLALQAGHGLPLPTPAEVDSVPQQQRLPGALLPQGIFHPPRA